MYNTSEFWMYILPISMVMITCATVLCIRMIHCVYKEIRYGIS